jgi:hypothetical protein
MVWNMQFGLFGQPLLTLGELLFIWQLILPINPCLTSRADFQKMHGREWLWKKLNYLLTEKSL